MTTRDYDGLKTEVADWLHRSNNATIVAKVPMLIALGEDRIYRDLRVRAMEASFEGTTAAGVVALPLRYVGLKHARIDGYPPLGRKPASWIYEKYSIRSGGGQPAYVARDGESLIFGPNPSDGVTVKGMYYQRLASLSADNTTNWFTENAFGLLLFATLSEAAPYLVNDARIPVWEGKYAALRDQIQAEDDAEGSSGTLSLSMG